MEMSKFYTVLPCNGLDKCAGCVARELAIKLATETNSEIICPVLYRVADSRYNEIAAKNPLLVIDGCATRCASKLAAEKGLKIAKKITVTEEAKRKNVKLGTSLRLNEDENLFVNALIKDLLTEEKKIRTEDTTTGFPETFEYELYHKDKFIFRVPKEGFYYTENDTWAYVIGNKARIGVTDFVQKSLSDILFFSPATIGAEVEQFDDLGNIESGKAVFEIISPVTGKVTAINETLLESPELININPYEKGWLAELVLTNFEEDKELLLDFDHYYPIMQRKVDEFDV